MIQFLFAVPVLLHALAHLSGFRASWTSNLAGFENRPWLLSPKGTLHSPVGRVFGVLWLAAMAVLLVAGLGLLFSQTWWPPVAIVGAVISLVCALPWWNALSVGAKLGAAFDLLILVLLLVPGLREQIVATVA